VDATVIARAVVAAIAIAAAAACSVDDVDLDGKQCPCTTGWICDTPTNTCVRDPTLPDAPPPDADPTLPDADVLTCPAGYVEVPGFPTSSRYRFVATPARWIDAELDCEDDGSGTHLAVMDSEAEQAALVGGALGGENIDDQWIGLTDLQTETAFGFVTAQTAVYLDMPFGDQGGRDCIRLEDFLAHGVRDCDNGNRYVCECDGMAADPARYPNPPNGNP
jgi:hypothetical protein